MQEIPWQSFLKLTSEEFPSLCWFWSATALCSFDMRDLQDWSQVPTLEFVTVEAAHLHNNNEMLFSFPFLDLFFLFFFFAFLHFLSNYKSLSFFIQIVIIPSLKHLMFSINSDIDLGAGPFPTFQFFSWWTNSTE